MRSSYIAGIIAGIYALFMTGCVSAPVTHAPVRDAAFYASYFAKPQFRSVYASGGIFYKDSRYDGLPFSFIYLNDGANDRKRLSLTDGIFNAPAADILLIGSNVRASIPFLKTNMSGTLRTVAPVLGGIDTDTLLMLFDFRFVDTTRMTGTKLAVVNDKAELTVDYAPWQDVIIFSPSTMRIASLTRRSYGNDVTLTFRDYRDDASGAYPGTVICAAKIPKTEIRLHFSMFVVNENVNWKATDFR
ncbi:MAG: hypothetical protein AABZ39_10745 [Spirochaetota bacterium]